MIKSNNYFHFLYGIFFLLLVGCGNEDQHDLNQWVQEQRNAVRPRVQALSEPLVFKPQPYISANGVEPFSKIKLTKVLSKESAQNSSNIALLHAEQNRLKEDLESYPLDSIVMVGSLKKEGQDTALLRVNQLIYPVRPGNYLGQNYGRITEISEQSIKLREVVQDSNGDWAERITKLDLQEGNK